MKSFLFAFLLAATLWPAIAHAADRGLYLLGISRWSKDSTTHAARTIIAATKEGDEVFLSVAPYLNPGGTADFSNIETLVGMLILQKRKVEIEVFFGFRQPANGTVNPQDSSRDPGNFDIASMKVRAHSFAEFAAKFYDKDVRYRFSPILEASSKYHGEDLSGKQMQMLDVAFGAMPAAVGRRTRGVTISMLPPVNDDSWQGAAPYARTFTFASGEPSPFTKNLTISHVLHGRPPVSTLRGRSYSNDGTPMVPPSDLLAFGGVITKEGEKAASGDEVTFAAMLDAAEVRRGSLWLESFNAMPFFDKPSADGPPQRTWLIMDRTINPIWLRRDGQVRYPTMFGDNEPTKAKIDCFGPYEAAVVTRWLSAP